MTKTALSLFTSPCGQSLPCDVVEESTVDLVLYSRNTTQKEVK